MKNFLLLLIAVFGCVYITSAQNVVVNPGNTGYTTLKAAFDAVNNGTHTGKVSITIIGNTVEAATATLNASGSGSASYSSVEINTNGSYSVTGAIAGPIISFNGASNVVLNGANPGTGTVALTISNTSTSANANTSTIRFINNASSISVNGCNILGSSSRAANTAIATGTILFSTGTGGGNNNIIISDNYIGPAGTSLPSRAVASFGSSSASPNHNNQILNNFIYDYFNDTYSAGIYLNDNNSMWTITGNRLYQTGVRTGSGTGIHYGIFVDGNSVASNFTISSNTVGYASEIGTGTYAITGAATTFQAISVKALGVAPNQVSSNQIRNISVANSGTAINYAINIAATANGISAQVQNNQIAQIAGSGNWYVLNLTGSGNNLQSLISANAIHDIHLTDAGRFYGILYNGGAGGITSVVSNNSIYNISLTGTAAGSATGSPALVGIYGASGPVTISDNLIGSGTADKSIRCIQTTGSTSSFDLLGIFVKGTDDQVVFNNTIGGFYANNSAAASGVPRIFGMRNSGSGVITFSLNRVGGSSDSSMHIVSNSPSASILGIYNNAGTTTINGNVFQNFVSPSGTGTLANSAAAGIVHAAAGQVTVNNNLIERLTASGTSVIGVLILSANDALISKNIIQNLKSSGSTGNLSVNGIEVNGVTYPTVHANKITQLFQTGSWLTKNNGVVNGILLSESSSASVFNNIVGGFNVTQGGGDDVVRGISLSSQLAGNGFHVYFNSVYLNASSSDTAFGSSALFHTGNPDMSAGSLYNSNNIFINRSTARGSGKTRAMHRSPDAWSNYFVYSDDNIYYSVDTLPNHFIYNDYKTLAAFQAVSGTRDTGSFQALPPFETVDSTALNYLHPDPVEPTFIESGGHTISNYYSDFYGTTRFGGVGYSGTGTAPDIGAIEGDFQSHLLPVKFLSFTAKNEGAQNRLHWSTTAEVNNVGFEIEKSADGKTFFNIGFVESGWGDVPASSVVSYNFVDEKPFQPISFYRLKQADKDGKFSYSDVVSVQYFQTNSRVKAVYPNPVTDVLNMEAESKKQQSVMVRFVNLQGSEIAVVEQRAVVGMNKFSVPTAGLPVGVYIVEVTFMSEQQSAQFKILKR